MSETIFVDCKHGKGIASIVCEHLINATKPIGFIENSSVPNDLQGWCFACEYYFKQEGGMTEKFKTFNSAKVVCSDCYIEFKETNQI